MFCDALDGLSHIGGHVCVGGSGLLCGLGLGAWAVLVAFGGRVSRDLAAAIGWGGWGFVVSSGTLGVGAGEVVAE